MFVSTTIALALLTASAPKADTYLDETCVECGTCDPFPSVIDEVDAEVEHSLWVPFDLHWVSIEGLEAEYDGPGTARWSCPADNEGTWHPVTFVVAVPETRWVWMSSYLKDAAENGWMEGSIEISYIDPDDTLWVVELDGLHVLSAAAQTYAGTSSGLNIVTDPDHPGTVNYVFTVQPSSGEVSAWEPSRGW